jgi:FG-GAP-like repeat
MPGRVDAGEMRLALRQPRNNTRRNAMRLFWVVVTLAVGAQAAVQPVSFKMASDTSPRTVSLATADFNGDGKMDLVIASADYMGIFIRLGNGDGSFQQAIGYRVQTYPASIVVGDFNADGKPDLAVADYGSPPGFLGQSISILLGNGDGTFRPAVNYSVALGPQFIAVGDFRGNGKLDLVVTVGLFDSISVLPGNGDGTFQPQTSFAAGLDPSCVVIGDFNGDGKLDLAVANAYAYAGTISILLGNGDGTFQPPVAIAAGSNPFAIAVGDFNRDGKLDLAVASSVFGSGTVILLGNGDGTFRAGATYADVGGNSIIAADFNGDGNLDLVVGAVTMLLGRGDGTFKPQVVMANNRVNSAAVGDFNGDSKPDLVLPESIFGDMFVLTNTTP